jgi:hypothetical protein
MQAEVERFVWTIALSGVGGVLFYIVRLVLARRLHKRLPAGLVPQAGEMHQPDAGSRLVSLIGVNAAPVETLGTHRLRASLGLKLVYWGVLAALFVVSLEMRARLVGPETAILCVVLYLALHTGFYEIRYDRETITLPRWWFGHTTRNWRDLDAVTERQGWFLAFHFRDGTVVQAHKYVVGYAALREKAKAALREV